MPSEMGCFMKNLPVNYSYLISGLLGAGLSLLALCQEGGRVMAQQGDFAGWGPGSADSQKVSVASQSLGQKGSALDADGVLVALGSGSIEGAKVAIKKVTEASKTMDQAGVRQSAHLIRVIKQLHTAQFHYKKAEAGLPQAEMLAEKYRAQAQVLMQPSLLTGRPKTYMAQDVWKKSNQVILEAQKAFKTGETKLRESWSEADALACQMYPTHPKDAQSLASVVEKMSQEHENISFESKFLAVRASCVEPDSSSQNQRELVASTETGTNSNDSIAAAQQEAAKQRQLKEEQKQAQREQQEREALRLAQEKEQKEKIQALAQAREAEESQLLLLQQKRQQEEAQLELAEQKAQALAQEQLIQKEAQKEAFRLLKEKAQQEDALVQATLRGEAKEVSLLLSGGASPNLREKTEQRPLVVVSALNSDISSLKAFIEAGVDVNAQDSQGLTALMVASALGQTQMVELLLSAGAGLEMKEEHGATALILAVTYGHSSVVEILLSAGADKKALAANGMNALDIATLKGHEKIIPLL